MLSEKKFIGGYVSPELYRCFDQQANEQGLSKNAFLESLLTSYQVEDKLATKADDPRPDFLLTDYFDEEFSQMLDNIFIAAGDSWQAAEDPQAEVFFRTLSILLETATELPLDDEEKNLTYQEVLPESLQLHLTNFIRNNDDELPEEASTEEFLQILAKAAQERAEELAAVDRTISIPFSATEWVAVQKWLRDHADSSDLPAFLRQLLGQQLQEAAEGFLWVEDEDLWKVGEGMI